MAAKELFEKIPGLCMGIIAVRAVNNERVNMEAEAFRRRCCTEANLLLKMNPRWGDTDRALYRENLKKAGITGKETDLDRICTEYKERLGIAESEEKEEAPEILNTPKSATLEELAGSDMLERVDPISDIVRAGMIKFHVNIRAYDMGDRKTALEITNEEGYPVKLGDKICTKIWLCEEGTAGQITKETENILVVITGFKENRKKVAAARNELARRMKSAFDRDVETGWLEGETCEFETEI